MKKSSIRPKVLFICGSDNQTTMMHEISKHLLSCDCYFTPFYTDGFLKLLNKASLLNFTVAGKRFQEKAIEYFLIKNLNIDFEGKKHDYELVVTCSDLVIQKNIRSKKVVLVQEGMTDPKNLMYYLVKLFKIPRYLASTSTAGLSHRYVTFCVASEGYKKMFIENGVNPDKLVVTGIPNFDNVKSYLNNTFRHKNYLLAATSDARETFKYENRKKFIRKCVQLAAGRQIIFKLHPNENFEKAVREIQKYAPYAVTYTHENTNNMIANCDILVTKYSSVVYIGLALNKEVYSDFNIETLKKLLPVQNGGLSGKNIALVCNAILENSEIPGFDSESVSSKIQNNVPTEVFA